MKYRLSICIPTLNRAHYIGETLDSIVTQLTDEVEVIIVDGGSVDDTAEIVWRYQTKFPNVRYFQRGGSNVPSNEGFDRDCDYAVRCATGEYCWLMTDDDVLLPGVLQSLLIKLGERCSLVVVAVQIRNLDLSEIIVNRRPVLSEDRRIFSAEWDDFARLVCKHLTFVGAVIIRRKLWIGRNSEMYFGTGFVHIGVIFQERIKGDILLLSQPMVLIRTGNAHWGARGFKIWMFIWPELVWSFSSISHLTKRAIVCERPWCSVRNLLFHRLLGSYSLSEFQFYFASRTLVGWRTNLFLCIAYLPRKLIWWLAFLYTIIRHPGNKGRRYELKQILTTIDGIAEKS